MQYPFSTMILNFIDLSKIRYHFTPCGSAGHDGPTFSQCEEYYHEHISPIATDGVLFQFDKEDFRGAQGFRIPREDVYNVTIAGAAGGRGLCNIHFGQGIAMDFQIQLSPENGGKGPIMYRVSTCFKHPFGGAEFPKPWMGVFRFLGDATCIETSYESHTHTHI